MLRPRAHWAFRDAVTAPPERHLNATNGTARRDPVLARLGLCPDQCGALVALLAGSRRYRHNAKQDSLLAAVRAATEHGHAVEVSPAQRRRLAVFAGAVRQLGQPLAAARELATAGV